MKTTLRHFEPARDFAAREMKRRESEQGAQQLALFSNCFSELTHSTDDAVNSHWRSAVDYPLQRGLNAPQPKLPTPKLSIFRQLFEQFEPRLYHCRGFWISAPIQRLLSRQVCVANRLGPI